MFLTGVKALIVGVLLFSILRICGLLPLDDIVDLHAWGDRILLTLGLFSPFITRIYPHIKPLRIAAIVCAVAALMRPYLGMISSILLIIAPVDESPETIYMLLQYILKNLPLIFFYLILLAFSLGEVIHIEMRPEMLRKWVWNIRNPTTYCLIPYYITLIGNIYYLFM